MLSLNQSERAHAAKGLDTRIPRLKIEMTWVHGDAATGSNAHTPENSVTQLPELEIWSRIHPIPPSVV
jgi:hypothetical protein